MKPKLTYLKPSSHTRQLIKELCKDMAQALESLAKK